VSIQDLKFDPPPDDVLFLPHTRTGEKVECSVCGTVGWPGSKFGMRLCGWQETCLAGHPYQCEHCERAFTSAAGRANHRRAKHPRRYA